MHWCICINMFVFPFSCACMYPFILSESWVWVVYLWQFWWMRSVEQRQAREKSTCIRFCWLDDDEDEAVWDLAVPFDLATFLGGIMNNSLEGKLQKYKMKNQLQTTTATMMENSVTNKIQECQRLSDSHFSRPFCPTQKKWMKVNKFYINQLISYYIIILSYSQLPIHSS